MTQRCGFVAVLGAPNAGKSTLVNALVGQKVAIVSAKAQTTRARLMGIAIEGDAQILLVDTPGIFAPRRRLDRAMVAAAWAGAEDADLSCWWSTRRQSRNPSRRLAGLEAHGAADDRLNKVDIARKKIADARPRALARLNPANCSWFRHTGEALPTSTSLAKHRRPVALSADRCPTHRRMAASD